MSRKKGISTTGKLKIQMQPSIRRIMEEAEGNKRANVKQAPASDKEKGGTCLMKIK